MTEEVLYHYNKDVQESSAVHWAAKNGSIATLEKAWAFGLNVHEASEATREGWVLYERRATVEYRPWPLQMAIVYGQESAVTWFLDHGADLDQRVDCSIDRHWTRSKTTLLHTALSSRQPSIALLLISRGASLEYPWMTELDPSFEGRHFYDQTPRSTDARTWASVQDLRPEELANALTLASYYGLHTVVEVLINEYSMDPNKLGRCGDCGQMDDEYVGGFRGFRLAPLSWAALNYTDGTVSTVKTLVRLGADIDGPGKDWKVAPLHFAIKESNYAVANALLDLGATVTPQTFEIDARIDDEKVTSVTRSFFSATPLGETIEKSYRSAIDPRVVERTALMKRLIKLGVDVNGWKRGGPGPYGECPLAQAARYGDAEDMELLLAAGATATSSMLAEAGGPERSFDKVDSWRKIEILLKHGARLHEIMEIRSMTMLQSMVWHTSDKGCYSPGPLHQLLLISSRENLSGEHLNKVLKSSLVAQQCNASKVLVRHGARIPCKDALFAIALGITKGLDNQQRVGSSTDLHLLEGGDKGFHCIDIILNLGLSHADQCLIFYEVMQKRQGELSHLFLDRGLATYREAAEFLPSYLMVAADWGDLCIIKRLWQQAPEITDVAFCCLLLQTSMVHGNRDAVKFFMDCGACPFTMKASQQALQGETACAATSGGIAAASQQILSPQPPRGAGGDTTSPQLAHKELAKAELLKRRHSQLSGALLDRSPFQLAMHYGHMDILNDLWEKYFGVCAPGGYSKV